MQRRVNESARGLKQQQTRFLQLTVRCQNEVKVFSYIAEYPILQIAQSDLHFTPWQTCSIKHRLSLSGSIQSRCKYCAGFIHKYPPLSTARYSFKQLSELERSRVKQLAQSFTRPHKGCLSEESEALVTVILSLAQPNYSKQ